MPRDRPNLTYNAPILSVDLPAFKEDGAPYEIWPCHECLPWHVEVIEHEIFGTATREWHAAECPDLQRALRNLQAPTEED